MHLLLILLTSIIISLLSSLGLLPLYATRSATAEWRCESKVDVLLGVETDDERWDVDDLLSDADVSLSDEDTGVMDGLGQSELVDTGLEAAFQEIFDLEGQDVIELHAGFVEHTDTNETANEGISFEESLWIFLVESEKLTSSTTNLGERELHTPHLSLVAETVFTDDL